MHSAVLSHILGWGWWWSVSKISFWGEWWWAVSKTSFWGGGGGYWVKPHRGWWWWWSVSKTSSQLKIGYYLEMEVINKVDTKLFSYFTFLKENPCKLIAYFPKWQKYIIWHPVFDTLFGPLAEVWSSAKLTKSISQISAVQFEWCVFNVIV